MRLIALETATRRAELAAADADRLLQRLTVRPDLRLTSALVPALDELLRSLSWQRGDIELVAIDLGPGSFTGTRIGLTCAKTLAYACSAELVGICSVDIVAEAVPTAAARKLAVGFDAARREVFCGRFERGPNGWHRTTLSIEPYRRWLALGTEGYLLVGPALERYAQELPPGAAVADRELWFPSAAALARLALRKANAGETIADFWTVEPIYMRPSAAEEKAALRTRASNPPPSSSAC